MFTEFPKLLHALYSHPTPFEYLLTIFPALLYVCATGPRRKFGLYKEWAFSLPYLLLTVVVRSSSFLVYVVLGKSSRPLEGRLTLTIHRWTLPFYQSVINRWGLLGEVSRYTSLRHWQSENFALSSWIYRWGRNRPSCLVLQSWKPSPALTTSLSGR